MAYQVLARKWRPSNFSEIVGQSHVVQLLTHALQHNRLHHAYLFTGTRGVGKTTLARILAKAINCENLQGVDPCGRCSICLAVDQGHFVDLLEVDAASRTKVEDTRDLLDNVQYAPSLGRYKVYLIDEIHMLSGHSFNALLKTLEEPPAHVKFLLATTDPHKIPVTVLSRCLQLNLKRLLPGQIQTQLAHILTQEHIAYETVALQTLARAADGSMRDALSLLDQAIAFGGGQVQQTQVLAMLGCVAQQPVVALLQALAAQDACAMLALVEELAAFNPDFITLVQDILHLLYRVALYQRLPDTLEAANNPEDITTLAACLSPEDVQLFYQMVLVGQRDVELAPDARMGFEMLLLRLLTFKPVSMTNVVPVTDKNAQMVKPAIGHQALTINTPYQQQPVIPETLVQNASFKTDDWPAMIQAMRLGGLTKQLASNCILESINDTHCYLLADPITQALCGAVPEANLEQALQKLRGMPVKLTIKIATESLDSPAALQRKAQSAKQQAAEQSIYQDANIRALQTHFDAKIIPGSIEPL